MHFSIFIPGAAAGNPKQLVPVGLGDLLRKGDASPQMGEIQDGGPSGGPGVLFVWPGTLPVYRPGELTWQAAKADPVKGLPAGRFWWGINPQELPTATELKRTNVLPGLSVGIKNQLWLMPNILKLPHNFILDDDGEEAREVDDLYRDIYQRGMWAYDALKAQVEGTAIAPEKEMRRYVVEMLALNYRMFRDLAAHLRLLGDQNWFSLASASVDIDTLMQIEDDVAKKKLQVSQAQATPPTS